MEDQFPKATKEELEFYHSAIQKWMVTHEHSDEEASTLCHFMTKIGDLSIEGETFQKYLYGCKQMLHIHNRTTGLMQMYMTGVAIGMLLCKPELLPNIPGEDEEEKGQVM